MPTNYTARPLAPCRADAASIVSESRERLARRLPREGDTLRNGARVIACRVNTMATRCYVLADTAGMSAHTFATWAIDPDTGETVSGDYFHTLAERHALAVARARAETESALALALSEFPGGVAEDWTLACYAHAPEGGEAAFDLLAEALAEADETPPAAFACGADALAYVSGL